MKKAIAVVIVTSMVAALFFLFRQRYYVSQSITNEVEIAYNDREAFVKVGKRIRGFRGSLVTVVLRNIVTFVSNQPDISEEIILFHLKAPKIDEYQVKNSRVSGSLFPYRGDLYYSRGVEKESEWPAVWKWEGQQFKKLEHDEALQIMTSFSLIDEAFSREHWQHKMISFKPGVTNVTIGFGATTNVLTLRESFDVLDSAMRFVIVEQPGSQRGQTLVTADDRYKEVTHDEFVNTLSLK